MFKEGTTTSRGEWTTNKGLAPHLSEEPSDHDAAAFHPRPRQEDSMKPCLKFNQREARLPASTNIEISSKSIYVG